jgi:hypothetical protein
MQVDFWSYIGKVRIDYLFDEHDGCRKKVFLPNIFSIYQYPSSSSSLPSTNIFTEKSRESTTQIRFIAKLLQYLTYLWGF